jgi:hypothetical protein
MLSFHLSLAVSGGVFLVIKILYYFLLFPLFQQHYSFRLDLTNTRETSLCLVAPVTDPHGVRLLGDSRLTSEML